MTGTRTTTAPPKEEEEEGAGGSSNMREGRRTELHLGVLKCIFASGDHVQLCATRFGAAQCKLGNAPQPQPHAQVPFMCYRC